MNSKLYHKRKLISAIIAGLYLFMVLFSGFFHTHSSFILKEGVSLKKTSTTKLSGGDTKDTCLLSHSSISAIHLHEQEKLSFNFFEVYDHLVFDGYEENLYVRDFYSFSLRGPPVV